MYKRVCVRMTTLDWALLHRFTECKYDTADYLLYLPVPTHSLYIAPRIHDVLRLVWPQLIPHYNEKCDRSFLGTHIPCSTDSCVHHTCVLGRADGSDDVWPRARRGLGLCVNIVCLLPTEGNAAHISHFEVTLSPCIPEVSGRRTPNTSQNCHIWNLFCPCYMRPVYHAGSPPLHLAKAISCYPRQDQHHILHVELDCVVYGCRNADSSLCCAYVHAATGSSHSLAISADNVYFHRLEVVINILLTDKWTEFHQAHVNNTLGSTKEILMFHLRQVPTWWAHSACFPSPCSLYRL